MNYTDNQIHDFYKFIQMMFVKDGRFRDEALSGINVYSQQVRRCFGWNYVKSIYTPLIEDGIMRVISDKYSTDNGFCKKYALTAKAGDFYAELKERVGKRKFTGHLSKKKVRGYLEDVFSESEHYFQYSIADARIHSPWVTVGRDFRHSFVSSSGDRLLIDLDLKTAYPAMLVEFLDNEIYYYPYITMYHVLGTYYKSDLQKFKELFSGDFYSNFISLLEIETERSEAKKIVNCLLNSSSEDRGKLNGLYGRASASFLAHFPVLDSIIRGINDGPMYLGGILAREFESPIIYALKTALDQSGAFHKSIIIHDGIEVWGQTLSPFQKDLLKGIAAKVLKDYRWITVTFKEYTDGGEGIR